MEGWMDGGMDVSIPVYMYACIHVCTYGCVHYYAYNNSKYHYHNSYSDELVVV